jgi:hypothetical protein
MFSKKSNAREDEDDDEDEAEEQSAIGNQQS